MSEYKGSQDPDVVFTDAYWAAATAEAPASLPVYGRTGITQLTIAQEIAGVYAPKIVNGDVVGREMLAGKFDPSDPELTKISPLHFPGAVLLTDQECLFSLDSIPSDVPPETLDNRGTPEDFAVQTRIALINAREFLDDGSTRYCAADIQFNNGEKIYQRKVSVVVLAIGKGQGTTPMSVAGSRVTKMGGKTATVTTLTPNSSLRTTPQIGVSFEKHITGTGILLAVSRLRSVEICRSGDQPAERGPRRRGLAFAVGNFATGDR